MNLNLAIPLITTTLVAIVGWIIVHHFSAKRDVTNKRRELQVEYLIDVYRQLERAAHSVDTDDGKKDVQAAIADIQLFGTPEQVEMAIQFMCEMDETGNASIDELLFDLRATLRAELHRAELQLKPVTTRIGYLRFAKKEQI